MSPEAFSHNFKYQSDIWSLGIIAYYFIHKSKPFQAFDLDEL